MEHEDNAQFDNYLQNAQQNLQLGNNTGNGDALVGVGLNVDANVGNVGCGGALGEVVKYDDMMTGENYSEDENEWKYIKEVNQSEKEQQAVAQQQQQQHEALHVGNGKSHEQVVDADDIDDDDDDYDDENMPSMQYRNNDEHHNGAAKDDFEAMHTDVGDFSQTSNTASTADGGCIDMLQVEMKMEPLQQQQQQQQQHLIDEEDPSSNATSSLSENAPMPQQLITTFDYLAENDDFMQNKENSNPQKSPQSPVPRPTELNFEGQASHLNPEAKEFVPSFGSNPTSPTMSETANAEQVGEPVEQPMSALSRHILLAVDDDVVARSPRKGREMDMDSENFVLPASEYDFDNEANKRPHEFEGQDVIGDQHEGARSPLPGPIKIMGDDQNDDVMKQSIYLTENGDMQEQEAIENILNTVQPLPTDTESLNSSFVDDIYAGTPEEARTIQDLLTNDMNADDEDHMSHPPSIEEMHMNLQNANNKDLTIEDALNMDMNSAGHMQESFYMEQQHEDVQINKEEIHDAEGFFEQQLPANESLLMMDTSVPLPAEEDKSTEQQQQEQHQQQEMLINNDDFSYNAKVLEYDEQNVVTNMSSPSPKSTVEEKHLMEETKEQLVAKTIQDGQQFVEELGKKMENLLSSGIDYDLKQESSTTQIEEPIHVQDDEELFEQIESSIHADEQKEASEVLQKVEQQAPVEQDVQTVKNENEIPHEAGTAEETDVVADAPAAVETAEIAAAAAVVATTAVAAAAVTAAAAKTAKKPEVVTKKAAPAAAKSTTSTAAKKPATTTTEAKKPLAKTSSSTSTAAATRPRTAPAKLPSSTASKTSVTNSSAAKKPATTTTTSSKTSLAGKPTASRPSPTSRLTQAAKSSTSTTSTAAAASARKPLWNTTSSTSSAATKPRSASAQPAKTIAPVTATKPKISPRATLTSQLRNKVATVAATTTTTTTTTSSSTATTTKATTVKSPTKPTGSSEATAGKAASATRIKSATSTAAGTTSTTKLFTARPAPKTTTTGPIVQARTVSKTSPLKSSPSATKHVAASPRGVANNMKAKTTTKEATKSPAQAARKTPSKTSATAAAAKPSKDTDTEEKEKAPQVNGVEEKVVEKAENDNESYKLQNGSAEPVNMNPIEIDGQV